MIPVKDVKNLKNNLKKNLEEFTLLLGDVPITLWKDKG